MAISFSANLSQHTLDPDSTAAPLVCDLLSGGGHVQPCPDGGLVLPSGVWAISCDISVGNVLQPDGFTPSESALTAEGVAVEWAIGGGWPASIVCLQGRVGYGSGAATIATLGGTLAGTVLDLTGTHGGCSVIGRLLGWRIADLPDDLRGVLED